jgi:hypothetical protein
MVGRGGGTLEQNAASGVDYLARHWESRRGSGATRYLDDGDMIASIISWMREEFGAP